MSALGQKRTLTKLPTLGVARFSGTQFYRRVLSVYMRSGAPRSLWSSSMRNRRLLKVAALLVGSLVAISARAQTIEGKFRGMYVCEKRPMTRDILMAPV